MQAKIGKELLKAIAPQDKPYEVYDTEMKGFGLRVQPPSKRNPKGAISFFVRYRYNGKQTRRTIGKHPILTPAQARDKAKELLAGLVKDGEDPAADKKAAKEHTLASYLSDVYGPWVQAHRKTGKSTLNRIEARFLPEFGKKLLGDITAWNIEKWRTTRLKDGKSPATVNRDLTALKAALSKAVEWGHLPEHPLSKVKPSKVDQRGKVRFLDADEEQRLRKELADRSKRMCQKRDRFNEWRTARGHKPTPSLRSVAYVDHLEPMILISINTGLRRGELLNLKWRDVDFQRANLTIEGGTAKSGSTRHIPLNAEALDTLKNWRDQTAGKGLVFPGKEGKPMGSIKTAWGKLLDDAGIDGFRWHDLRHHFASRLVMAGVDLNTVRELLGHSDLKMTLRYAHLAPEHKAAAVAKLDRVHDDQDREETAHG